MLAVVAVFSQCAKPIMSDILVYVNESSFCCVIAEDIDATLEAFRREMEAQVDDLLCFPFKFTRLVNGKRVVVGIKQEVIIKLKQCIEESHEPAIYLIREETKTEESAIHVEPSTSQDADREKEDFVSPPTKKPKISQQPTLFDLLSPGRSEAKPKQPYSAARARKIKIYSHSEIANSSGMTKVYREFWNAKGEELCRSSALSNYKPGEIQGAINVAWTLEKSKLIKDEVHKVNDEINRKCPDHLLKKFQLSRATLEKNVTRVEKGETSLQKLQQELTAARIELIDSKNKSERQAALTKVEEIEKELESQLAELRRAQDSLRKAIDARQKLLQTLDANRSGTSNSSGSEDEKNSGVESASSGDEE